MDAGFGAAGEHEGGVAAEDEARGVADGMRAGGAGCGDGVVGALLGGGEALGGVLGGRGGGRPYFEAVFHGDVAGGEVDEEAGDEEGGYFFRALGGVVRACDWGWAGDTHTFVVGEGGVVDVFETADSGADADTLEFA